MKATNNKSKIIYVFKYTMATIVLGSLYLRAQAATVTQTQVPSVTQTTVTQQGGGNPFVVTQTQVPSVTQQGGGNPFVVTDQSGKTPVVVTDQSGKTPVVVTDQSGKTPVVVTDQSGKTPVVVTDQSGKTPVVVTDQSGKTPVVVTQQGGESPTVSQDSVTQDYFDNPLMLGGDQDSKVVVDQISGEPSKTPVPAVDQDGDKPKVPAVAVDQDGDKPKVPTVAVGQDGDKPKVPTVAVGQDGDLPKVPTVAVDQDGKVPVPVTVQDTGSDSKVGSGYSKNYECLERYREVAGKKSKYRKVYHMFYNNSREQNDLIKLGNKKKGYSEDNVREIVEIGFKTGAFCPSNGDFYGPKEVEAYVLNFSAEDLNQLEVSDYSQNTIACINQYQNAHKREKAKDKRILKFAAGAGVLGALSGNGLIVTAAFGTGLYTILHKSDGTKTSINYGLLNDAELDADSKEFIKLYREITKQMGGQLSADPRVVEQLIVETITEGFQSDFCAGEKLLSPKEIREYAAARIYQTLNNGDAGKVATGGNVKVNEEPREIAPAPIYDGPSEVAPVQEGGIDA